MYLIKFYNYYIIIIIIIKINTTGPQDFTMYFDGCLNKCHVSNFGYIGLVLYCLIKINSK